MYEKTVPEIVRKKMNPKGTKMFEKNRPRTCTRKTDPEKKRPIGDSIPQPLDNSIFFIPSIITQGYQVAEKLANLLRLWMLLLRNI